MDGARLRGGLVWVAAGVLFELWFTVSGAALPETVAWILIAAIVALAGAVVLRSAPKTVRKLRWVVAALLAVEFAGAVADRFGAFGGPGDQFVSWGDWPTFVAYTGELLPWAPHALVVAAAVSATVTEVVLAGWLASGRAYRWAGKAAAGVLTVYLVVMACTVGLADVARYAVPLLVGGALLTSVRPADPGGAPVRSAPRRGGRAAQSGDRRGVTRPAS
jgi:hypothetical protein